MYKDTAKVRTMKKRVAALLNGFVGALTLRWGMYALAVMLSFFTPKVHLALATMQDVLRKNEVLYKGVEFMLNTLLGIPGVIVMILILLGTLLWFTAIEKIVGFVENERKNVKAPKIEKPRTKEKYFIRLIKHVGGMCIEDCKDIGEKREIGILLDGRVVTYKLDAADMAKATLINDDKKEEKQITLESGEPKNLWNGKITLIYCPVYVE